MTALRIAVLTALSLTLLTGCSSDEDTARYVTDPNGVLGISGTGWFWIIMALIGGVVYVLSEIFDRD